MKRSVLFIVIPALCAFASCTKVKQLANISVNIPYSVAVTMPQGLDTVADIPGQGVSVSFPSYAVVTNSEQYLSQYHTNVKEVISMTLKSLSLQLSGNGTPDFNFLDSVQIFISGKALPESLVAYDYNIPKGHATISLITSGADLKEYFLQDTMYIRLQGHFNAIPASGTVMNVNSKFHLVANPLY